MNPARLRRIIAAIRGDQLVNAMEFKMKTERRWLKAAIAAATEVSQTALPFQRGTKHVPLGLVLKPIAIAAR